MVTYNNVSATVQIEETWFGQNLTIVKKGNGSTSTDSTAQTLSIDARPSAPNFTHTQPTGANQTGSVIIPNGTNAEWRKSVAEGGSLSYTPTSNAAINTTDTISNMTPGLYYFRTGASLSAFASQPQEITIAALTLTKETTPVAQIDYAAQKLKNLTANKQYRIVANGQTSQNPTSSGTTIDIRTEWFGRTIQIYCNGDFTNTIDSEVQNLAIPSIHAAPQGILKTDTNTSQGNGVIENVSDSMEWRSGTTGSWTAIGAGVTTIDHLMSGTYQVRYKATASAFASQYVTVTITYIGDGTEMGGGEAGNKPTTNNPNGKDNQSNVAFIIIGIVFLICAIIGGSIGGTVAVRAYGKKVKDATPKAKA